MDGRQFWSRSSSAQETMSHSPTAARPARVLGRGQTEPDMRHMSPNTPHAHSQAQADMTGSHTSARAWQPGHAHKDSAESAGKRAGYKSASPASLGKDGRSASPGSWFPFSDKRAVGTGHSPLEEKSPWSAGVPQAGPSTGAQSGYRHPPQTGNSSSKSAASTIVHEIPQAKSSKRSTLHLLNPVNLLMRRRSGVPQEALNQAYTLKASPVPPMTMPRDYDPRIRGSVVHDFSAPRPQRTVSQQKPEKASPPTDSPIDTRPEDIPLPSSTVQRSAPYTGNFREQLHDGPSDIDNSSAVRAEALANQDFLKRISQTYQPDNSATQRPVNTNVTYTDFQSFRKSIGDWQARVTTPSPISSKSDNSVLHGSQDRLEASSPPAAGQMINSATNAVDAPLEDDEVAVEDTTDDLPQDKHLPRHAQSNASRFSFQLRPHDQAVEEQLLEQRARRRAADLAAAQAHAKEQPVQTPAADEDDEDYFDEDAMYDVDEFEQQGDDGEYDDEYLDPQPGHIGGTTLDDGLASYEDDFEEIGREADAPDINGAFDEHGGWRYNHEQFNHDEMQPSEHPGDLPQPYLGDTSLHDSHQTSVPPTQEPDVARGCPPARELVQQDQTALTALDGTQDMSGSIASSGQLDQSAILTPPAIEPVAVSADYTVEVNDDDKVVDQIASDINQARNVLARAQSLLSAQILSTTPASMGAHQDALADVTNKTVNDDKFTRSSSTATSASLYSKQSLEQEAGSAAQIPKMQPYLHPIQTGPMTAYDYDYTMAAPPFTPHMSIYTPATIDAFPLEEDDGFDDAYADLLQDDAIISAANAEVLASDDEGFYGREFGFYARARPGDDATDAVAGGFFGTPGQSTIERKFSVKEPNLTPITEHSEHSARNSYYGGGPMSTPGFAAHLARLTPLTLAQLQDEDMTLDQLFRLQNRSLDPLSARSASVSSLSSSGLPLATRKSWANLQPQILLQQPMVRSQSENPVLLESPIKDPQKGVWLDPDVTPRKAKGHMRSRSGDSVAYSKETGSDGRERWILERRRVGEDGLEVIGREVVEGGI